MSGPPAFFPPPFSFPTASLHGGLTCSIGEKLRRRLDDLEALAASVAESKKAAPAEERLPQEAALPPVEPISDETSPSDDGLVPRQTSPEAAQDAWAAPWAWGIGVVPSKLPSLPYYPTPTPDKSLSSLELSSWDSRTHVDPSHLILSSKPQHVRDVNDVDCASSSSYYTALADCGCPVRHVEVHFHRSSGSSPNSMDAIRLIRFGAPTPRPTDPYMNHLRVEMACNMSAMWLNSMQLGLSEEMLCDDDGMSPFYRPTAGVGQLALTHGGNDDNDNNDNNGVVRTVQRTYKTLKPDLRPTREQILIPHHPCIDAFPFPTLRRNLLLLGLDGTGTCSVSSLPTSSNSPDSPPNNINSTSHTNTGNTNHTNHTNTTSTTSSSTTATASTLALVDEDAFFHDMIDGLICWAGAGLGRRDRDSSTGRAPASCGTPWDVRSWEARPWFLRKYWALLGGEEGELVRQSEWWRGMRGEDEDIWSGGC